MKTIIKLLTVLSALLIGTMASGQDDVTLTVSGEGATKDEATTNALRGAIEQTYGVFVSSDFSLMNEAIVKDEIATLAKGNVKSYEELSSIQLPDNSWCVTLRATVSPSNLIEYTKAHGGSVEFAGAMFTQSMKLIELNTKNEKIALDNMYHQLCLLAPHLFYYTLENLQDPKIEEVFVNKGNGVFDLSSERYYAIYADFVIRNNVYNQEFYNLLHSTLKSISLTKEEQQQYSSRNVPVYPYFIYDAYGEEEPKLYYLRNDISCPMFNVMSHRAYSNIDKELYEKQERLCKKGSISLEQSLSDFLVVVSQTDGKRVELEPVALDLRYRRISESEGKVRLGFYGQQEILFCVKPFTPLGGRWDYNVVPGIVPKAQDGIKSPFNFDNDATWGQIVAMIQNNTEMKGYIAGIGNNYSGQSFLRLFKNVAEHGCLCPDYGKLKTFDNPGSEYFRFNIKLVFSESELAKIKSIEVVSDSHQAILPK